MPNFIGKRGKQVDSNPPVGSKADDQIDDLPGMLAKLDFSGAAFKAQRAANFIKTNRTQTPRGKLFAAAANYEKILTPQHIENYKLTLTDRNKIEAIDEAMKIEGQSADEKICQISLMLGGYDFAIYSAPFIASPYFEILRLGLGDKELALFNNLEQLIFTHSHPTISELKTKPDYEVSNDVKTKLDMLSDVFLGYGGKSNFACCVIRNKQNNNTKLIFTQSGYCGPNISPLEDDDQRVLISPIKKRKTAINEVPTLCLHIPNDETSSLLNPTPIYIRGRDVIIESTEQNTNQANTITGGGTSSSQAQDRQQRTLARVSPLIPEYSKNSGVISDSEIRGEKTAQELGLNRHECDSEQKLMTWLMNQITKQHDGDAFEVDLITYKAPCTSCTYSLAFLSNDKSLSALKVHSFVDYTASDGV